MHPVIGGVIGKISQNVSFTISKAQDRNHHIKQPENLKIDLAGLGIGPAERKGDQACDQVKKIGVNIDFKEAQKIRIKGQAGNGG